MEKQWKISSIVDLVYNHAANDCILLRDHPEASYNLVNSPHLKAAVLLDAILIQFTRDASEGKLLGKGIPAEIKESHLEVIHPAWVNAVFISFFSSSVIISWKKNYLVIVWRNIISAIELL